MYIRHGEYVSTSFKPFKWHDIMYTVKCNKTKFEPYHKIEHEIKRIQFLANQV